MTETIGEARARDLLQHTWHGFFGRFGRLTATQKVAIGPIRAGEPVVLCAPTASGKTEAVLGPLVDRLIAADRDAPGLRILVICPTRALCNDLHRRIANPLKRCRWTSDIKTGDDPSFDDDTPPKVVVTTPESFDSMLCRRPASLQHVAGLFLDELHLLDGTARGDHLRALVERQRRISKDLQVCAASATAADASRLAKEFCGDDARAVAAAPGADGAQEGDRALRLDLRQAFTLEDAERVLRDLIDEEPGSKILVFANTRAEVEWLASRLSDRQVFAHHGSLSRGERLRAEKGFLQTRSAICVATMTLELGVDIGDVDRVVLINPPPNVASFTQRVGRSNRRGTTIQATGLVSSPFDEDRFRHYLECATEGRLFPERIPARPSLLPQQALSLLFQNPAGWVSAKALHARLPAEIQGLWTWRDGEACLRQMREMGVLHADAKGRYVADEPARRDFRYGRIHAHIDDSQEVEVIDETTGRVLGTAAVPDEAGALLLAGRRHDVTRIKEQQVFVTGGGDEGDTHFLSRMGPRYSFGLARDLARFLGHERDVLTLTPSSEKEWTLEHYAGTLWGRLLAVVLRDMGVRVKRVTAFTAVVKIGRGGPPERLGSLDALDERARRGIKEGYKKFLKPLQGGPFMRYVPEDLKRRWVMEALRPDEFARWASHVTLAPVIR